MSLSGDSSIRKRSHQACVNCRRKKTRCPGERPVCSTCRRLRQSCQYIIARSSIHDGHPFVDERLARLEEKLELVLNHVSDDFVPAQEQTPLNIDDSEDLAQNNSIPQFLSESSPELSEAAVDNALGLYFKQYHKNPIWCFEREDINDREPISRELVCAVLALTSRSSASQDLSQSYTTLARTLVMTHIANGTVTLMTIESLCLLSHSLIIDANLQLARFHLGLALQLCKSAGLDLELPVYLQDVMAERKKRLFWSLKVMEYYYGQNPVMLDILCDTTSPSYFSAEGLFQSEDTVALKPPSIPSETTNLTGTTPDQGIWWISVPIGCVWSKTRAYVSECATHMSKPPWNHRSTYATILSDLTEIENQVPMCYRYDSAKFYERQAEDIDLNRAFWYPWLRAQFTYHTIHVVLNHPYLYIFASRRLRKLEFPNTFWRKSSELALLHASWIARMIDMASEKQIQFIDPFFAHAAAVAATVHLHFCCAADSRLKLKSKSDLTKCRMLLRKMSGSPAVEGLEATLDKLICFATGRIDHDLQDWSPSSIRIDSHLVWEMLQFDCNSKMMERSDLPNGLLHPSLVQSNWSLEESQPSSFEVQVAVSPDLKLDTTDGGQSAPISSGMGHRDFSADGSLALGDSQFSAGNDFEKDASVILKETFGNYDSGTSWLWAEDMAYGSAPTVGSDFGGSSWWDNGNL